MQRIVQVLLAYALSEGGSAEQLRWPDGVNVATALQDLIRFLTAAQAADATQTIGVAPDATLPDGADAEPDVELPDGAAGVALPDGR
jgi:hypothetical protein